MKISLTFSCQFSTKQRNTTQEHDLNSKSHSPPPLLLRAPHNARTTKQQPKPAFPTPNPARLKLSFQPLSHTTSSTSDSSQSHTRIPSPNRTPSIFTMTTHAQRVQHSSSNPIARSLENRTHPSQMVTQTGAEQTKKKKTKQ